MDTLERHVDNFYRLGTSATAKGALLEAIDNTARFEFVGKGAYGSTFAMWNARGDKLVLKLVVSLPPDRRAQWRAPERIIDDAEGLVGTFFNRAKWKFGYAGDPVPLLEDRVGPHFASKADDPWPNLVDYEVSVKLENEDLAYVYDSMFAAGARGGMFPDDLARLRASIAKTRAILDEPRAAGAVVQRAVAMIMEAGEIDESLWSLAEDDPGFPRYVRQMLVQVLSTLHLARDHFVHGDLKLNNVVRLFLAGPPGRAMLSYLLEETAETKVYLRSESDGAEYPVYLIVDFGQSRFPDAAIERLEAMRRSTPRHEAWLEWVPEWEHGIALAQSHALDLHGLGMNLLFVAAKRIQNGVDALGADTETMWNVARFAHEQLLLAPENVQDGMHRAPRTPSAFMMRTKAVYTLFVNLLGSALERPDRARDLVAAVGITYSAFETDATGGTAADLTNIAEVASMDPAQAQVFNHFWRFPKTAVLPGAQARPRFWAHPIFDDGLRAIVPKAPPAKRTRIASPEDPKKKKKHLPYGEESTPALGKTRRAERHRDDRADASPALAAWAAAFAGPKRKAREAEEGGGAAAGPELGELPPELVASIAREWWTDPEPPPRLVASLGRGFAHVVRAEIRAAGLDFEGALANIFREEERLRLFFSPLWKFPSLMAPGAFADHWALAERWMRVHRAALPGMRFEHVFLVGIPTGQVSPFAETPRGLNFHFLREIPHIDVSAIVDEDGDARAIVASNRDSPLWAAAGTSFEMRIEPRREPHYAIATGERHPLLWAIYVGPARAGIQSIDLFERAPAGGLFEPGFRRLEALVLDGADYWDRTGTEVAFRHFAPGRWGGFRVDVVLQMARARTGRMAPRPTSRSTKNALVGVYLGPLRDARATLAEVPELAQSLATLAERPWNYDARVRTVGDPRRGGLLLLPLLLFVAFMTDARGLLFPVDGESRLRRAEFSISVSTSVDVIVFPKGEAFERKLMPRDAVLLAHDFGAEGGPSRAATLADLEALGLVFQGSR